MPLSADPAPECSLTLILLATTGFQRISYIWSVVTRSPSGLARVREVQSGPRRSHGHTEPLWLCFCRIYVKRAGRVYVLACMGIRYAKTHTMGPPGNRQCLLCRVSHRPLVLMALTQDPEQLIEATVHFIGARHSVNTFFKVTADLSRDVG